MKGANDKIRHGKTKKQKNKKDDRPATPSVHKEDAIAKGNVDANAFVKIITSESAMPPTIVTGVRSDTVDDESSRNKEEWHLVGNENKSPRPVSPSASTADVETSVSPSRFHILNEDEEGEAVADGSSPEEDDGDAPADI